MKALADKEGYETFVIPDDIGGRFSVITPVGLLPIAVAGIDIDALMKGLHDGMGEYGDADLEKNAAYRYAVARRILQNQGYDVELLVNCRWLQNGGNNCLVKVKEKMERVFYRIQYASQQTYTL